MGPHPLGPEKINGLLVPPSKVSSLLTGHLITAQYEPAQEKLFKSNYPFI